MVGGTYRVQSASKAYSGGIATSAPVYNRFEVRSGDYWPGDTLGDRERSEVAGTALAWNTDYWCSYAFMLSGDVPTDTAIWHVLGQFHASEDAGDAGLSPVFAFELEGTKFRAVTRSDPNPVQTAGVATNERWAVDPFSYDVWHDIVMHIRFDSTQGGSTNGLLELWHNGAQVYSAAVPIGYNDTAAPYWKFGIYRAATTAETLVARYANMELSTSSLAARVTSPAAHPTLWV